MPAVRPGIKKVAWLRFGSTTSELAIPCAMIKKDPHIKFETEKPALAKLLLLPTILFINEISI
jgi:hypothetical protein